MYQLWIGAEAKLFCLAIVVFLFVFQKRNDKGKNRKQDFIYLFSVLGIVFAILSGTTKNVCIQKITYIACGISNALSALFLCLSLETEKKTDWQKIVYILLAIAVSYLSFCTIKSGSGIVFYGLTFSILAVFIYAQYNKIRVDNLTKLYNRYGMDIELKEQLRQYRREHTDSFYIIACDLDNFKHINDTWGHPEGDRALKLVANLLAKVGKKFRSNVFRIGGDEFIIITDTSEEGLAAEITDAIKNALDKLDFRDDFTIGMSIGTALYDGVISIDDLLNSADKRLYEAKKNGKK